MLENLIPVSGDNSLRQVIATVFTQGKFLEASRFEKYLTDLNYQKFEKMTASTVSVNMTNNKFQGQTTPEEVGFRMTNFVNGRINTMIQTQQKSEKIDLTEYGFYSFKYPKWENFKKSFLGSFEILSKEDNPFVTAVSLAYVNDFFWKGDEDIEIDNIFNKTDSLSDKFFASQNSTFFINTESKSEKYKSIERLEITVSKSKNAIQVNTQLVFEFTKPFKFNQGISDSSIGNSFEEIHNEIKESLRNLFTPEVKQKINLI